MGIEIERKFLVRDWEPRGEGVFQRQGYLAADEHCAVRVRLTEDSSRLCIKSGRQGIERDEYEYDIPRADAERILATLCGLVIEKTRYVEEYAGRTWEVDVFLGENAGLVTAEVELERADEDVELPPWIAAEVSHDPRYSVAHLSRHPYGVWKAPG